MMRTGQKNMGTILKKLSLAEAVVSEQQNK